jgi:hypothetical protein
MPGMREGPRQLSQIDTNIVGHAALQQRMRHDMCARAIIPVRKNLSLFLQSLF